MEVVTQEVFVPGKQRSVGVLSVAGQARCPGCCWSGGGRMQLSNRICVSQVFLMKSCLPWNESSQFLLPSQLLSGVPERCYLEIWSLVF